MYHGTSDDVFFPVAPPAIIAAAHRQLPPTECMVMRLFENIARYRQLNSWLVDVDRAKLGVSSRRRRGYELHVNVTLLFSCD
mmetsp:Transcript_4268/g.8361  ORF Transcript_4268/g.8361 Transcript_4268/m.8361 type:complete len:82 (-) Transcript_4268:1200-1445(-)